MTDSGRTLRHVRFVPEAEVAAPINQTAYVPALQVIGQLAVFPIGIPSRRRAWVVGIGSEFAVFQSWTFWVTTGWF
jgi:hypothetical protein